MATEPMIKGVFLTFIAEKIQALVMEGSLDPEAVTRNIPGLNLLGGRSTDEEILASKWYPISLAIQVVEFLEKHDGQGDPLYLRKLGKENFEYLKSSGMYRQLDLISRRGRQLWRTVSQGLRRGTPAEKLRKTEEAEFQVVFKMAKPIFPLLINFGELEAQPHWTDNRLTGFTIELKGMDVIPQSYLSFQEGILDFVGELFFERPATAMAERPDPSVILLHVKSPLQN